jgi:hypothetical protein
MRLSGRSISIPLVRSFLLPALLMAACGDMESQSATQSETASPVMLNERIYFEGDGGQLVLFGGGCNYASGLGAAAPADQFLPWDPDAPTGDLGVRTVDNGREGMRVTIESGGTVLQRRSYTMNYLRAGTLDHFSGTAHNGRTFQAFFWGGACSADLSPPVDR